MDVQLLFGISVAFGFVAWAVVTVFYIWPELRDRSRIDALRPLLTLHGFRFIGLSFLVPGVVSADLPIAFARDAAYGDVVAAILALLALTALRSKLGIALVWVFNIWGSLDPECVLCGQCNRIVGGSTRRRLFHSHSNRSTFADNARSGFPHLVET